MQIVGYLVFISAVWNVMLYGVPNIWLGLELLGWISIGCPYVGLTSGWWWDHMKAFLCMGETMLPAVSCFRHWEEVCSELVCYGSKACHLLATRDRKKGAFTQRLMWIKNSLRKCEWERTNLENPPNSCILEKIKCNSAITNYINWTCRPCAISVAHCHDAHLIGGTVINVS